MANVSYVQTDFRGGRWSARAQGAMADPMYKKGMAACLNSMPLYTGSWTRRPGFLWGGTTRGGKPGKLIGIFLKLTEPLQLEFTDGNMRAHVGNGFVFTSDIGVTIKSISAANPAVVTVNGNALPTAWVNYDQVVLSMIAQAGSPSAPSAPALIGRQFSIRVLSATTFSIYDSLTGLPIDGSTFTYVAPTNGADYVYKIADVATPYSGNDVNALRSIHTEDVALLLHKSFQPQSVTVPPIGNLALSPAAFIDGPYLNINTTANTATPGSTSGSVAFAFSATTNVNGGQGFQQSDIGRAFRFQSGPPAWAIGTTYPNSAIVTGSDNNIYQSTIGGNIGHDPTTDTGTNWVVTGQTIIWVWGYITVVTDSQHITVAIQPAAGSNGATVPGNTLFSTDPSVSWALGVYSNTTGWPATGCYHEGRFGLAGSCVPDRFDFSVSNDPLNFSPSAYDGTVADSNAISYQFNAEDNNTILWMLTGTQGVLCGTTSGEWIIRASSLGDPLTPTSIQAKRVSKYGCANIEPQITELVTCFVQREGQRVMDFANYPYGETAGWFGGNLSEKAEDICAPGIAEIRWQQEPSHFLWARCNDGSLIGTTFEHAAYGKESYNGWHNHAIGGGRTVTSISTGPMANGVSSTLYAIAYNPVTTYYEFLELGPLFDNTAASWAPAFTDGVAQPSAAVIESLANGGSFNGVRIYGMHDIIGQTVSAMIGGLDLGDFVVQGTDGHIDIPFTSVFTLAFLNSFNNGTNYGVIALPIQPYETTTYNNNGFGAYSGSTANQSDVSAHFAFMDSANDRLITLQTTGIRSYTRSTMNEITDATWSQAFYNGPSTPSNVNTAVACYHPGTNAVYMNPNNSSNSEPIVRIDMGTLRLSGTFGVESNSLTPGPTGFTVAKYTMIPLSFFGNNYVAAVCLTDVSHFNQICIFDANTMSFVATLHEASDADIFLCPGRTGVNEWFGIGTPHYGGAASTAFGIYNFALGQATYSIGPGQQLPSIINNIIATRSGSVAPTAVDAAWTNFSSVTGPAYDPTDGNLLVFCTTTDVVTHQNYWVKVNPHTGAVVWKLAVPHTCPYVPNNMCQLDMNNGFIRYALAGTIYTLHTDGTSEATASFPSSMTSFQNQMYWPEQNAIIGSVDVSFSSGPPVFLGTYMQTHTVFTGWGLITTGAPASNANWPPPDVYDVPASIGANYTSIGQLLRPDFGQDAGAQAGPAFGKKRRVHWYAAAVERSQAFNISTNVAFPADATDTVPLVDEDENVIAEPALYTGTLSSTMPDNYSFDGQIAWQVVRPTPLTVTAMGGYIAATDK